MSLLMGIWNIKPGVYEILWILKARDFFFSMLSNYNDEFINKNNFVRARYLQLRQEIRLGILGENKALLFEFE